MSKNILSCNMGSYRKFRPHNGDVRAYRHLQGIGVRHVEIGVPSRENAEGVLVVLRQFELTPTTLQARCDLSDPNVAENVTAQLNIAADMNVKHLFVSVKAGDMPKTVAYGRLREAGGACASSDSTLCIETHPDLAHNAGEALSTMRGVNHPNVRINFDTANVYYYNEGINAVTELEKIKEYVSAVHLKDTNGAFKTWNFPTLGEGVVDFAGIFRVLNVIGMFGPFTMELEGIEGEDLDFEQTCARVSDSVEHLRKLGVIE